MPRLRSLTAVVLTTLLATPVMAQQTDQGPDILTFGKPGGKSGGGSTVRTPVYYSWMSPEVQLAWDAGSWGQYSTITVVDDFSSRNKIFGNLGHGMERLRHGEWTRKEAGMIATSATMVSRDFFTTTDQPVSLNATGLDVLNLSYGYVDDEDAVFTYDTLQASIISAAHNGGSNVSGAFVSKSAGNNYGTEVGHPTSTGKLDFLARDLIGAPGVVFVGALEGNGSSDPASMADYSNVAGDDPFLVNNVEHYVRDQFLVVEVESDMTGLAGTSFAAPIVSAYAGMLGHKFADNNPTPEVIADTLLSSARRDNALFVGGYNPNIHGMGQASIERALSAVSVE